MKIPLEVKETGKCPVLITHIPSPSSFWFQVKGRDHSDQIGLIINKMTSLYLSEEGANFKLTDMETRTLRNPKLVAAPFFNKYYRALVLSKPNTDFTVTVLYVDYGNTNTVNVSDLFRLKPEYCRLPCQAVLAREVNLSEKCSRINVEIECRLDKIQPLHAHFEKRFEKGDKFWPVEAVPVQLKNKDDVSIVDLLQDTLDI